MTKHELALYHKCTKRFRKAKPLKYDNYVQQHEYDADVNEDHDYN